MKLSILKILNDSTNAVFHDDGLAVYNKMLPSVKQNKEVELSFEGIKICTTQFLNACVGKLLMEFGSEHVKKHIHPTQYAEIHAFSEKYSLVFSNFEEKNRGAIEEAYD